MTDKNVYVRVRLQAERNSPLGRIICRIRELPQSTKQIISELLYMHYSARVFSNDDETILRQMAVSYTNKLVGEGRTAQQILGIDPDPKVMTAVAPTSEANQNRDDEQEEGIPINTSSEKLFGG